MNTIARMIQDIFESNAGRINFTSSGWVYNPSTTLLNKTKNIRDFNIVKQSADDRTMTLVMLKSVSCLNPEVGSDIYPRLNSKKQNIWSVPASVCKKCKFYKIKDSKFKFVRCLYKSQDNPYLVTISDITNIVGTAVKEVNGLMSNG